MKEITAAQREHPELEVLCDYPEWGMLPLDELMAKKESLTLCQLPSLEVCVWQCLRAYILLFYKKLMLVVLLGILWQ